MTDWNKYAIEQANLARKVPQIERSVAGATIPDYLITTFKMPSQSAR